MNGTVVGFAGVLGPAVCIGLCGVAIPAFAMEGSTCDNQTVLNGNFVQVCDGGQWRSRAFPIDTTEVGSIDVIHMVHNSNPGVGHLYLVANDDVGGYCPDTSNVLWSGCGVITGQDPAGSSYDTGGVVPVTDTTWIVAVPQTGSAFDIAYTTGCPLPGVSYASFGASPECADWVDSVSFCHCVSAETDLGSIYPGNCNAQDPDEPLCVPECPPAFVCQGDVNG